MQLFITEKESTCKDIARVIGASQKDGYFEGVGCFLTWCRGHLVELAEPEAYDEKYKKWNLSHLPIIPKTWKLEVSPEKRRRFEIVKSLMNRKDVSIIVNATDAGREGELIFRYVYGKAGCKKPVKRFWTTSLVDSAIVKTLKNLEEGAKYDHLYHSAWCRANADWLVGINLTRFFTLLYNPKNTFKIGRIKTPTLAMIVERDHKIKNFIKDKYYMVRLDMGGYEAISEHIQEINEAREIKNACENKESFCKSVKKENKSDAAPVLFDLTLLQREANRLFGYKSQETLDIAQQLYEEKYTTYPRTDSNFLPSDMNTNDFRLIILSASLAFDLSDFYMTGINKIFNDKKVTDHYAIVPTVNLSKYKFDDSKKSNILKLICARLLCAVSDKHTYEATTIELECSGHTFKAKGRKVLDNGWKKYDFFKEKVSDDIEKDDVSNSVGEKILPEVSEGERYQNKGVKVTEHETQPPKAFTENTLLAAMEKAGRKEFEKGVERTGLGTSSTRAPTIESLLTDALIKRDGKKIISTPLGAELISIAPEALKSPLLTVEWENKLLDMSKGNIKPDSFMEEIENFVKNIIDTTSVNETVKKNVAKPVEKEVIGTCIRCESSIHESKTNFYCSSKECSFQIMKEPLFFKNKQKTITKTIAKSFLKNEKAFVKGLISKNGKKYDADVYMVELKKDGKTFVNFEHRF